MYNTKCFKEYYFGPPLAHPCPILAPPTRRPVRPHKPHNLSYGTGLQRRQSGLKSGGSSIRVSKISIFSGTFTKNRFSRQILKNSDFFQTNFQKISILPGKFSKKFLF